MLHHLMNAGMRYLPCRERKLARVDTLKTKAIASVTRAAEKSRGMPGKRKLF